MPRNTRVLIIYPERFLFGQEAYGCPKTTETAFWTWNFFEHPFLAETVLNAQIEINPVVGYVPLLG